MAAGEKAKITWGTSFANTLEFGYPLDQASSYPQPRQGSEFGQSPGGEEDSWVVATDELLSFVARWIPAATGTTPEGTTITGWDGATGFAAFLSWARAKNPFRFFPLRTSASYVTCYLMEPMQGGPQLDDQGTRQLPMVIRSSSDAPFTGY